MVWKRCLVVLCAMVCLGSVASGGEPVRLFDGSSLDHWKVIACEAEIVDGAILLKSGNGLVQTKKCYGDYTFTFEWKALHPELWDSGIYFRYDEVPEGRPWPRKYQVNLRRNMEGDLVGFEDAQNELPVKPHEWNRFELTVKGKTASLKVDGKLAWEATGLEQKEGHIALQAEIPGGGQFLFRNISITELD
ncbi:MAG: DUF1080 domain-containing protein [Pirellulaceae bacterium]